MRLAVITVILIPLIAFACSSCEKRAEYFPSPCNCEIEQFTLSEPSLVTYQVSADADATISSITYQTGQEQVTVNNPQLPFNAAIQLEEGQTVSLTAVGNPKNGSIILTYETRDRVSAPNELSSSVSRVWIRTDDTCQ